MGIAAVFASPTVKGCRPCCRISIPFKQAFWCGGGASAFGDRIFNRLDRMFLVAPWSHRHGSDGMDRRPHIVAVEDETTQRRLLVDYLTRQNFRVSGADGAPRCASWWSATCQRSSYSMSDCQAKTDSLWRGGSERRVPALASVRVGRNVAHCRDLAGQIGLRRELAGLRVQLADAFGAIMRREAMRTNGHQNGREPVTMGRD
jgi:hypothetical protein